MLKKRLDYEKANKKGHVHTLFKDSLSRYSCTLYVLMLLAAIIFTTYKWPARS